MFALTRGPVGLMGGHLFRSDGQGKTDTWDDRTNEMTGQRRPADLCLRRPQQALLNLG